MGWFGGKNGDIILWGPLIVYSLFTVEYYTISLRSRCGRCADAHSIDDTRLILTQRGRGGYSFWIFFFTHYPHHLILNSVVDPKG